MAAEKLASRHGCPLSLAKRGAPHLPFSTAELRSDRGAHRGLECLFMWEMCRDGPHGLAALAVGSGRGKGGGVPSDAENSHAFGSKTGRALDWLFSCVLRSVAAYEQLVFSELIRRRCLAGLDV